MYHHVILKYSKNYFQTFHCSPSSTTPSPGLAGTWLLLGKVIICCCCFCCCCCYCCWVCCFLCCCFVAWIFWSGWDVTTPANFKQDYNAFSSNQKSEFLLTLIKVGLPDSEIEEMWFSYFLFLFIWFSEWKDLYSFFEGRLVPWKAGGNGKDVQNGGLLKCWGEHINICWGFRWGTEHLAWMSSIAILWKYGDQYKR